jgi:dUTPase
MAQKDDITPTVTTPANRGLDIRWLSLRQAGRLPAKPTIRTDARLIELPCAESSEIYLPPETTYKIRTGVALTIPAGYLAHVYVFAGATELWLSHTIPAGDMQEICVRVHNRGPGAWRCTPGAPCAVVALTPIASPRLADTTESRVEAKAG